MIFTPWSLSAWESLGLIIFFIFGVPLGPQSMHSPILRTIFLSFDMQKKMCTDACIENTHKEIMRMLSLRIRILMMSSTQKYFFPKVPHPERLYGV